MERGGSEGPGDTEIVCGTPYSAAEKEPPAPGAKSQPKGKLCTAAASQTESQGEVLLIPQGQAPSC